MYGYGYTVMDMQSFNFTCTPAHHYYDIVFFLAMQGSYILTIEFGTANDHECYNIVT